KGTGTATGGSYSIAVSALTAGTHSITATATDVAGNVSPTTGALSVTIDNVAPTVTINQATGQADPTNTSPITFTAVFSEVVTGFSASGVTITGTATGTKTVTVTDTGDQKSYTVSVTGMTGSGTVIATVNASAAQDTAGNNNAASTSTDNTVTYDITPPAAPSTPDLTAATDSGSSNTD